MSEGMLFDIGYENGITPALAMPEKPVPMDLQQDRLPHLAYVSVRNDNPGCHPELVEV